jgi:hypothetical protein
MVNDGRGVVGARRAALVAEHPLEEARRVDPCVQRRTADTQRIGQALRGAGTIAVKGDGKIMNAKSSHARTYLLLNRS